MRNPRTFSSLTDSQAHPFLHRLSDMSADAVAAYVKGWDDAMAFIQAPDSAPKPYPRWVRQRAAEKRKAHQSKPT